MTAPAVRRAETLLTRVITIAKGWASRDRVTLRAAELGEIVRVAEEARQEILSIAGPPTREHITPKTRARVIERAGFCCQECGLDLCDATARERHIDHIVPVARFGATRLDNLQLLCGRCNLRKGAKA